MVVKNGVAYVQAGGGIVADSTPEGEYQESVNKSRALVARWKPRTAAEGSKMVLLLDNYDSFTYNWPVILASWVAMFEVHRNDKISVEEIARRKPESIVISPVHALRKTPGFAST